MMVINKLDATLDSLSQIEIGVAQLVHEQATPFLYNVQLTLANTEYSQALPENTRAFSFCGRTSKDIRYAFASGQVVSGVYKSLKSGEHYWKENVNLSSQTIFFASSDAGVIVELEVWT